LVAAPGLIFKGSMPAFYDPYLGPIQFAVPCGMRSKCDPNGIERATEAVKQALEEKYGSGEFEAKNQAIFISAEC
jgi:hypothetical protein